jgi:FtsH-binding integral membrane protein
MSQMNMPHPAMAAAQAGTDERLSFIRRTYVHLFGAILLFTIIETALFSSGIADRIGPSLLGGKGWIVVFVLFLGASWFANRWAMSGASPALQYAGLGVFIVAQSVIFLPLLYVAMHFGGGMDTIAAAGSVTVVLCGLTTLFVLVTKKDFSFMGWGLMLCSGAAFVAIILGLIFGWQMGGWFSALMIVLGLGYLLYETSNILHRYRTDQHVAASLALFSSVMLVFFYVLRLFLDRR